MLLWGVFLFQLILFPAIAQLPSTGFHPLQLHADKQFFLPGETVFFAVYKVTPDSLPVRGCTVALVDEKGRVLDTRRLLLTDEPASSFFILPSGDSAQYYTLQCRMGNRDAEPVTGTLLYSRLKPIADAAFPGRPALQLHPESGQQPGDKTAVYYFRVTGYAFSDTLLRYAVLGNETDTLCTGIIMSGGAGRMELPAGYPGSCTLVYSVGVTQFRHPFTPRKAEDVHAVLNVYPVSAAWVCRVRTSRAGAYTLQLLQEGSPYYRGTVQLQAGDDFSKTFTEQQLRRGLSILRLYDAEGRLAGERPVFRQQADPLKVAAVKRLRPDKIRVQLNEDLTGFFSVSVTPDDSRFYTSSPTDDTLLQAGSNKLPLFSPALPDSLLLQVKQAGTGAVYAGKDVKIFLRTTVSDRVLELQTDSVGNLWLDRSIIEDSASLLVLPRKKQQAKEKLSASEKQDFFSPDTLFVQQMLQMKSGQRRAVSASIETASAAFGRYKAKLLKEVVVKTRTRSRMEIVEETYASPMYRSKVHQVAAFDFTSGYDNELMGTMLTFLQSRVPPVKNTSITSGSVSDGYNYYVNESLVDRTTANSIPLSDIAYISVMGRKFVPVTP